MHLARERWQGEFKWSRSLRIAILGIRGIPNRHGGLIARRKSLSVRLVRMGHEVTVYNTDDHLWWARRGRVLYQAYVFAGAEALKSSARFCLTICASEMC